MVMVVNKVQVGLVGVGGIAQAHLKHITKHPNVELVALCDISKERVENQAKIHKATPYTDVDEMLQKEKLSALFVCIPPFAHGDLEEKAAQLGIHLLVEKPVELNIDNAQRKLTAIQQAGIINAVGYCLRYLDTVQMAKDYLQNKEIAMVRGYYLTSFVKTPWYRVMKLSGGQLVEQATHVMDLMRYLGGEIAQVYADMSLQVLHDIEDMDIPDVTSVNVRYENGAVGHMDCTMIQHDHRWGVELMGRDFRVTLNGSTLTINEKGQEPKVYNSNTPDFYKVQADAFIEAILTNNQDLVLADYEESVRTLQVTLAANESAEKNTVIKL